MYRSDAFPTLLAVRPLRTLRFPSEEPSSRLFPPPKTKSGKVREYIALLCTCCLAAQLLNPRVYGGSPLLELLLTILGVRTREGRQKL